MSDGIAERLHRLDTRTEPWVERFDSGPPLVAAVAVLPSAFNPPTDAHRHLLERAVTVASLAEPMALLTTRNVDKGLHGASLEDRVGMLLALAGEWPELVVAASNQARIVDQADALRAAWPGVEFDFVLGFDTLERLFAERYYTDIERELAPFFERHRVLAANRGEARPGHVEAWMAEHTGRFRERVMLLEIDEFPASLSSSQVREAIAGGRAGAHISAGVARYIEERALYR